MNTPVITTLDAHTRALELKDEFHRAMRYQLDVMLELIRTIHYAGSASNEQCEKLADLTAWFNLQARQHHMDEEERIFPTLRQLQDVYVQDTLDKLQLDHDKLEARWNVLEPELAGLAARQGWMDLTMVEQQLTELCQLYTDHMLLEETIFHPETSALLHVDNREEIMEAMRQRRLLLQ